MINHKLDNEHEQKCDYDALHHSLCVAFTFSSYGINSSVGLIENALTDGDLTDAAVEGSGGDIVATTAGLTVCKVETGHTSHSFSTPCWRYSLW